MTDRLKDAKVAFLATDMFEQVELTGPWEALKGAGAQLELISLESGEIQGFDHFDKADRFKVDRTVEGAEASDYDALVLPGGVGNPDALRMNENAVWAGENGYHLMSSTLLLEDTQVPFDELQAEQIGLFREAWRKAGHEGEPRVSVSRSVMPVTSDLDRRLFGSDRNEDQVGWLDGAISRFGRTYSGEPDRIATELAGDAAVQAADTILLTVPSQLGVSTTPRCSRRSRATLHPRSAGLPAISRR